MAVEFREWVGQYYEQYLKGLSEAEQLALFNKYAPLPPIDALTYIEKYRQPAVSTAGDLTITDQVTDETPAQLEVWEKLGYKSYEEYFEAIKAKVDVREPVGETQPPIAVHVGVDTIGWEQVNPIDPEFPDAPIIQVAEDNFVQAFYQVSEAGTKYPAIINVSSEGGSVIEATTKIPARDEMPLGARIELALKTLTDKLGGVDFKIVLAGAAIVLLIIGIGLSRR